jgi:Rhodopirellula transposase DDE domain
MTAEDAVAGIAATTTYQGLKVTAVLDESEYPRGREVSGQRMRYLEERILDRQSPRGEWNYAVRPAPRAAPGPEPARPQRPGRCPQAMLNHPALTGMDPADLTALTAALQVPFGARREQDGYTRRGGRRVRALMNGDGSSPHRRIDLTDHVLAVRLRDHLHLTTDITGALLGVDRTTISHAISLTRQLLTAAAISLPPATPPGTRLRTPDDLHDYAAAAGITLTIPQTGPKTPKHTPRKQPGNRDTPEMPN